MPRKSKTTSGTALAVRIGRSIKKARAMQELTQAQLAEILGIESVTVSRIETGAQLPSIDRLDEVAKALQVSLTTLLADTDTSKSNAMTDLLVNAVKELPAREQKFVLSFALTYSAHYQAGKKK
jgi:transcriptional regulator with XRE-family HTH domain